MDTKKIAVFCYWNGCIKDGPDGPFYEGSSPRVIRVENTIKLPKLLDDLHRVTGFEKGKFQIDLVGRYPSIVQQSMVKYIRLPVVDDCSLETMLEVPSYHPFINNVELFLEVKPVTDEGVGPASHPSRKRSREEDANVYVSTDAGNCRNGINNEAAQKASKMKNPGPTKGASGSVSKPLIFSSVWLDESELHVGVLFRDKAELEKTVKMYSDRRQRGYDSYKYSYSFEFLCNRRCGWTLKAAETKTKGFEITEYTGPHSCKPTGVCSDFLAGELEGLIKAQPSLSIEELNKWVKEEFGYTVSVENMWNAKKKAITSILGDVDKSFSVLPKFMAVLCSSNKMLMDWQYDIFPNPKEASFRSVFWAFRQSVEGFTHLRPLIIVDTIDLSGKYPGKMLVSAGFDADNRIFPLAFAIVTEESLSADSWRWFFACIRKKVTQREDICLITSLDPEIVTAVKEPECQWARHRFCLRHLCLKFFDIFQNNLMTEFVYKAGSRRCTSSFDSYLKKIEMMNPEASKWLDKMPPRQWALAHDNGGMRWWIMTTNTISTMFGFVNKTRDYPITTCILLIFDHVAKLFKSRLALPEESGDKYAKHVMTFLEGCKVTSTRHDVLPLDKTAEKFKVTEVMQDGSYRYFVNLIDRICSCMIWQVYKYPCSHVLAVCRSLNSDHLQYVDDCYNTENSLRAYAAGFNPLPGVFDWPEASEVPRLLPPGSRPTLVTTAPTRKRSARASKGSTGKKKS